MNTGDGARRNNEHVIPGRLDDQCLVGPGSRDVSYKWTGRLGYRARRLAACFFIAAKLHLKKLSIFIYIS